MDPALEVKVAVTKSQVRVTVIVTSNPPLWHTLKPPEEGPVGSDRNGKRGITIMATKMESVDGVQSFIDTMHDSIEIDEVAVAGDNVILRFAFGWTGWSVMEEIAACESLEVLRVEFDERKIVLQEKW